MRLSVLGCFIPHIYVCLSYVCSGDAILCVLHIPLINLNLNTSKVWFPEQAGGDTDAALGGS